MSKKFRSELEAMDVDQVTEKLGDYYEKLAVLNADQEKGWLKKVFNRISLAHKEHVNILLDVAADKNNVDKSKVYDMSEGLKPIVRAAEARGSESAAKLKKYIQLQGMLNEQAREFARQEMSVNGSGPIKTIIKAIKNS